MLSWIRSFGIQAFITLCISSLCCTMYFANNSTMDPTTSQTCTLWSFTDQVLFFLPFSFSFLKFRLVSIYANRNIVGIVRIWYWSSTKLPGLESWRLYMKNTLDRNSVGLQQWNRWINFHGLPLLHKQARYEVSKIRYSFFCLFLFHF